MNIRQAIIRSRAQRIVGCGFLLGGTLFYLVSLLMALYHAAKIMTDSPLLWQLGAIIQNMIASIFELTSPYIGFIWRNVPTLDLATPFTYGNLLLLGFLGVMIVGKQLMLAGRRLRARIHRQIERIEEMQWHHSMMPNNAPNGTSISANTIGQINISQHPMPPNPEGEWWARPWGVIGLSVISGYLVAVLSKLTGML